MKASNCKYKVISCADNDVEHLGVHVSAAMNAGWHLVGNLVASGGRLHQPIGFEEWPESPSVALTDTLKASVDQPNGGDVTGAGDGGQQSESKGEPNGAGEETQTGDAA